MSEQFPYMNDTKFPGLRTVDPYSTANLFDYTRWGVGTTIKLCNVAWCGDYENVVKFDSDKKRDAYFDGIAGETVQLESEYRILPGNSIKLPIPFDDLVRFNYLVVDFSTATSNSKPLDYATNERIKRFCFFVDDVKYAAPSTTETFITLDVWTTYINRVGLGYSYLERGHAPMAEVTPEEYLENPIANNRYLIADDVSFGEPAVVSKQDWVPFGNGVKYVLVATTVPFDMLTRLGTIENTSGSYPAFFNKAQRNGYQAGVNMRFSAGGIDYTDLNMPRPSAQASGGMVMNNLTVFAVKASEALNGGMLDRIAMMYPQLMESIEGIFVVDESMIKLGDSHAFIPRDTITWRELSAQGRTWDNLKAFNKTYAEWDSEGGSILGVGTHYTIYEVEPNNDLIQKIDLSVDDFAYPDEYKGLAKLYTYPYSALEVTDGEGNDAVVKIEDTGSLELYRKVSLAYPYIHFDALLAGVGSSGKSVYTWRDLHGVEHTESVPYGDFRDYTFGFDIPAYSLYMRGYDSYRLHNYNAKNKVAENNARTAYENGVESANTAYENALASYATNNTNTNASISNTYENVTDSNATANTNALNSNETGNTNALNSNETSFKNSLDSNNTNLENALSSNATNNTISHNNADLTDLLNDLAFNKVTGYNKKMFDESVVMSKKLNQFSSTDPTDTGNGLNVQNLLAGEQIELEYLAATRKILADYATEAVANSQTSQAISAIGAAVATVGGIGLAGAIGVGIAGVGGLGAATSSIGLSDAMGALGTMSLVNTGTSALTQGVNLTVGAIQQNNQLSASLTKNEASYQNAASKVIKNAQLSADYANRVNNLQNEYNGKILEDNRNYSIACTSANVKNANTNADLSKNNSDDVAKKSKNTSDINVNRTRATADANANRTRATADANANRTRVTADANANRTRATADANANRTRATADANANRTRVTADNNALRTRSTDNANAARSFDTSNANALYDRNQSITNAQRDVINAYNNAQLAYSDRRFDKAIEVGTRSGDPVPDETALRGLQVRVKTQPLGEIAQTGDYFLRYGYALNQQWHVTTLNVMPHFTYWKFKEIWLNGAQGVIESAQREIKNILCKGVTVWSNPDEIGTISIYDNRR